MVLSLSEFIVFWSSGCCGCSCCWLLVLEEEWRWRQLLLIWLDEADTLPVCRDQWGNLSTPPVFTNPFPPAPNFRRCSATTSSSFCILYLLVNLKRRWERIHIMTEAAIRRHPNTAAIIIKFLHSSIITTLEDFWIVDLLFSLFSNGWDSVLESNSVSSLSK